MAVSLMDLVHERGVIISEEAYTALLHSVAEGFNTRGIVWCCPAAAIDPTAHTHPLIYTRFDDTGKQQMCVRFSSGAIQVLATEP